MFAYLDVLLVIAPIYSHTAWIIWYMAPIMHIVHTSIVSDLKHRHSDTKIGPTGLRRVAGEIPKFWWHFPTPLHAARGSRWVRETLTQKGNHHVWRCIVLLWYRSPIVMFISLRVASKYQYGPIRRQSKYRKSCRESEETILLVQI